MKQYCRIILILSILSGCAPTQTSLETVKLKTGSEDAYVVLKVQPVFTAYTLNFAAYDPVSQRTNKLEYQKNFPIDVSYRRGEYMVRKIKSGRYVLNDFRRQGIWANCFHEKTVSFEILPNQIVYLGSFNPAAHNLQLDTLVRASGRTRAQAREEISYFDDIIPPEFSFDEQSMQMVQEKISQREDYSEEFDIIQAEFETVSFKNFQEFLGDKLCGGGLYRKKTDRSLIQD